nr:hypothetical protein [Tanacetum cinerariifolium]
MNVISNIAPSDVKTVKTIDVNHKGVFSTEEPKPVMKNNFSPPIIEDWHSDDESEEEISPTVEVKTKKTAQEKEFANLKKRVKKLERKRRSITLRMNLFKIGTSRRRSLGEDDASKHGRNLKQRLRSPRSIQLGSTLYVYSRTGYVNIGLRYLQVPNLQELTAMTTGFSIDSYSCTLKFVAITCQTSPDVLTLLIACMRPIYSVVIGKLIVGSKVEVVLRETDIGYFLQVNESAEYERRRVRMCLDVHLWYTIDLIVLLQCVGLSCRHVLEENVHMMLLLLDVRDRSCVLTGKYASTMGGLADMVKYIDGKTCDEGRYNNSLSINKAAPNVELGLGFNGTNKRELHNVTPLFVKKTLGHNHGVSSKHS